MIPTSLEHSRTEADLIVWPSDQQDQNQFYLTVEADNKSGLSSKTTSTSKTVVE